MCNEVTMKHKAAAFLIIGLLVLISGCAQFSRQQLQPIQYAKLNVKLFTDQIKAINDALEEQLQMSRALAETTKNPDLLLKKLKIEHKLDKKLKRANTILKAYTREVQLWEKTGNMSPDIIPYEHEFRAMMVGIMNLLNELQMENMRYQPSANSTSVK